MQIFQLLGSEKIEEGTLVIISQIIPHDGVV